MIIEEYMNQSLDQKKKINNIIKLENRCVPVYAKIELRGVPWDRGRHIEVIKLLAEYRDEASSNLGFTRVIKKKVKKYNEWCLLKEKDGPQGTVRRPGGVYKVCWEEEIQEIENLNLRSHQQRYAKMLEIFQKDLGPEFNLTKRENGVEKNSSAEDVIKEAFYRNKEKLSTQTKSQIQWVLQYMKACNLMSKYGVKFIGGNNGKKDVVGFITDTDYIYPNWFQIGEDENAVTTGRSSSSKPNMQNIPAREELFPFSKLGKQKAGELFRSIICAKPGWTLVVADFSQIEPRVAAEFCKAKELIRRFRDNTIDIHAWVAKIMLGLDHEPDKDSYERKFIGKTAGLSILYGKFWSTLKEWMFKKTDGIVDWTDVQAKERWENFFKGAPEFRVALREWERKAKRKAEDNGYTLAWARKEKGRGKPIYALAKTMCGRPRRFTLLPRHFDTTLYPDEAFSKDYVPVNERQTIWRERIRAASVEGFNHHIQGTAADIMKMAACYVDDELEEAGLPWEEGIIALVHDEIVLHVREENALIAKEILERCMAKAGNEVLEFVPIKADAGIGKNWAIAKP
jgi:DNA polymerase-1